MAVGIGISYRKKMATQSNLACPQPSPPTQLKMKTELRPQPGKQEAFLKSSADVAFFGGGAGSGKSFGLLLEPLYDVANAAFRSVISGARFP